MHQHALRCPVGCIVRLCNGFGNVFFCPLIAVFAALICYLLRRFVNQRVEANDTSHAPWFLVSCVKINQAEIFNRCFCVNNSNWNENVVTAKALRRVCVKVNKFMKQLCD